VIICVCLCDGLEVMMVDVSVEGLDSCLELEIGYGDGCCFGLKGGDYVKKEKIGATTTTRLLVFFFCFFVFVIFCFF
jgi:hypothetical protein